MNSDTVNLLKIKIEQAKRKLPLETVNAIDAVDWKAAILELRAKKGYNFEQLGDLETETELLLAGLVSPEDYPKELERRMRISKANANELVNEMNEAVFKKIREELVKNTERKKIFQKSIPPHPKPPVSPLSGGINAPPLIRGELEGLEKRNDTAVLNKAGIEIFDKSAPIEIPAPTTLPNREEMMKKIERPEEIHPILTQKLSASFQTPTTKTDHSLNNLTPNNNPSAVPKFDPYRETPE